jgi:hypothetical protein
LLIKEDLSMAQEHEYQRQRRPQADQHQRTGSNCLVYVILILFAISAIVVWLAQHSGGSTLKTTVTGSAGGFRPDGEAVYRAQDLNQVRVDLYQNGGHTDGRNLGLAEVVAQFKDGSEKVLYVSPPRWGDKNKHSEVASMQDAQTYLGDAWKDHLMQDIKAIHILVVSQFDICRPCVTELGQIANQLRSQLTGIRVIVTLWQVHRYINPYNPDTWIAPTQPSDLDYRGMV